MKLLLLGTSLVAAAITAVAVEAHPVKDHYKSRCHHHHGFNGNSMRHCHYKVHKDKQPAWHTGANT